MTTDDHGSTPVDPPGSEPTPSPGPTPAPEPSPTPDLPPTAVPGPTTDPEPPAPAAPAEQPDDGLARAQRIRSLEAYLTRHRERYTLEALRRAAVEAGYTEAEFDQATTASPAVVGWPPPGRAASSGGPKVLPTIGTIVAFIGALWALAILIGTLAGDSSLYWILYIAAIGLAVLGWVVLRQDHPSVARGLGCAVLITFILPIAVFVAILGYCVVTGNMIGNP
jgi:hypothetical protein